MAGVVGTTEPSGLRLNQRLQGGESPMKRLAWALAGAVWLSCAAVAAEESPLIGKWEGTWKNNTGSDRFFLTVTSVEGSVVRGTSHVVVSGSTDPAHNKDRA